MKWTLIVVLLSSGPISEKFQTEEECIDHLIEYAIITKLDLWQGTCVGPFERKSIMVRDIGP